MLMFNRGWGREVGQGVRFLYGRNANTNAKYRMPSIATTFLNKVHKRAGTSLHLGPSSWLNTTLSRPEGQSPGQGGATTHIHMQPTLPARPHSASRRSGRSHNTRTHAANPAGQTTLGKSPVREEPQHTHSLITTHKVETSGRKGGGGGACNKKCCINLQIEQQNVL